MAISRKEVEKVSLLGRLLLSEEELDKMTSQMGDILAYMDLLSEVEFKTGYPVFCMITTHESLSAFIRRHFLHEEESQEEERVPEEVVSEVGLSAMPDSDSEMEISRDKLVETQEGLLTDLDKKPGR